MTRTAVQWVQALRRVLQKVGRVAAVDVSTFPLGNRGLLPERQNFEGGVAGAAKGDADGSEDRENELEHELNLAARRNAG